MKEIIELRNIAINVPCSNWEEAISISGDLLVTSSYVKEEYVNEMIETMNRLGPYFVLMPQVALVHARPSDLVIKEGISLITLKEPINFGNKHNDPVKVVLAFGARNTGKHLDSLQQIAQVLEDKDKVEIIMNAKTSRDIYNILNNKRGVESSVKS